MEKENIILTGGTIGLFMGASIVSMVEFGFYIYKVMGYNCLLFYLKFNLTQINKIYNYCLIFSGNKENAI